MIAVTVLLVALTAVLPDILTEGQREKEEELLFRGGEYERAIYNYHARFNRYPAKIEDLIKPTNGMRFLRHAYPDPMSRSGKWRFIHANGGGVVVDSRMLKTLQPMGSGGPMGGTGGPGGTPGSGLNLNFGNPGGLGTGGPGASMFGGGQEAGQPQNNPEGSGTGQGSGTQTGTGTTTATTPSLTGSAFSNDTAGLFIVGVASTSHKKSFRIYMKQKYYDDWEFLGLPMTMSGMPGGGGMPGGAGMSGGMNPQPSGMGMQPSPPMQSPFGNPNPNQ